MLMVVRPVAAGQSALAVWAGVVACWSRDWEHPGPVPGLALLVERDPEPHRQVGAAGHIDAAVEVVDGAAAAAAAVRDVDGVAVEVHGEEPVVAVDVVAHDCDGSPSWDPSTEYGRVYDPVEEQEHGRTGAWTMNSSFRCEKSQWAAAHAPVVAVVAEEEPAPWTFENWGTRQKA